MKPLLDKDEVEQLDEQQLEAYAQTVLATERDRKLLLDHASGYRGRWLSGFLFLAVFIAVSLLDLSPTMSNTILCVTVFAVVQWHATGINRRIDAVIRLGRKIED
ncbi:hypothetical protein [Haloferula sp.]|uniref:hypothetical protein n=1 Tax=Haloferula sp. TaxID=2497595 RepID=UPI003C7450FE